MCLLGMSRRLGSAMNLWLINQFGAARTLAAAQLVVVGMAVAIAVGL